MRRCIIQCSQRSLRAALCQWRRAARATTTAVVASKVGFDDAARQYQASNSELVDKVRKAHL